MKLMTNDPTDRTPPQKPRSEPEIIPPGREGSPWVQEGWPFEPSSEAADQTANSAVFITVDEQGRTHYRTFTPPGPFTIGLVLALIGLVGAAILMLALGFVLFLIPVVAVAVVALVLSGRIRTWWRRLARN
ncbi:MAG: hypothetical protein WAU53_22845 [Rhodoplanes sp.]